MVKNCDLGLENATLSLRPRAVFSRPRSQFFPIQTSQPANNIYMQIDFLFRPSLQSAEPEKLRKKIVSFHNYDFRPKLHDMKFNYHFIISIFK